MDFVKRYSNLFFIVGSILIIILILLLNILVNNDKKEKEDASMLKGKHFVEIVVKDNGVINLEVTNKALDRLKVDKIGLDNTDRELLLAIINKFNGGPVGIDAISSSIGEEVTTIEDVYEPYLLQQGLLKRTSRGRIVTDKAYEVLGIEKFDKNKQTSLDLN